MFLFFQYCTCGIGSYKCQFMFLYFVFMFVYFVFCQSSDKKRSHKHEQLSVHRQLLIEYLTHLKLTQSIQRNLLLLETFETGNRKAKPEEFVRVYDILLQVSALKRVHYTLDCCIHRGVTLTPNILDI